MVIPLNFIKNNLSLLHTANPTINIDVSEMALLKMAGLIEAFDGEVGWHGTVNRTAENAFVVEDILVYPQDASAASIDTDQHKYEMWLMGQEDNIFKRLRMHGHSHVNFSATPSSKDDKHRNGLTAQLAPGMFYLFLIWNKKYQTHTYVQYKPDSPYGPENIKLYVTLAGKRIPIKKLPLRTLRRLLDCDMVKEFVAAARESVNEGRLVK